MPGKFSFQAFPAQVLDDFENTFVLGMGIFAS